MLRVGVAGNRVDPQLCRGRPRVTSVVRWSERATRPRTLLAVDAPAFLGLESTHNPNRWYLPIVPGICAGGQFLFGGCGLGAGIAAMEATTGRRVVWATAQYLSYARPPQVVDLDVWVPNAGKYNTQARVVSHVDDKEILTVNAALGSRPSEISRQWVQRPDVPPPLDCPVGEHWRGEEEDLHSRIETRVAKGLYGDVRAGDAEDDGRLILWIKPSDGRYAIDSSMLAVIADPTISTHIEGLANKYNESVSPVGDRCVKVRVQSAESDRVVSGFANAWPSELDLMARIAGLRLKQRWGGWNREPFNSTSSAHVSVYGR